MGHMMESEQKQQFFALFGAVYHITSFTNKIHSYQRMLSHTDANFKLQMYNSELSFSHQLARHMPYRTYEDAAHIPT